MEKINELTDVRKLATIARILKIEPIPEADNIETVYVRGWKCVVKKSEFQVGDLCVYAEVDSVFPDGCTPEQTEAWRQLNKELSKASSENDKAVIKQAMKLISDSNTHPEFEFLRSSKFRIKTKRILGSISQGICFPMSILKSYIDEYIQFLKEDDDVTKLLGVTQYIPPDPAIMGGDKKGDMQNLGLMISDEERCLDENTLIETEDGNKTIKEICEKKYTGNVLSYNLDTLEKEWKPILSHSIMKNNNDWFCLILENGQKLLVTSNHKVYLPELNCFRQIKDLNINENIKILLDR